MRIQTDKTSFIFYKSFYDSIKDLPKENQLEVYNLIFEYCFYRIEPKNNNTSTAIFKLIKPNIDANNKRYFANIENGKKGGAPVGNNNANKHRKQPKNNPKTTQKQPKTTFNEDVDVDVDVDVNELCIMNNEDNKKNIIINNNIKKKYLIFYNKIKDKKEYAEFVYLTEEEAERLINEFGKLYFDKATDYLSLWKQEKLNLNDKKACKGDDNLKIRKWVISKIMEDFKKQDYEAYRKYEETRKKATNPEVVRIIKDLLDSGYATDKKMLLETDFEKLKLWHDDFQNRKEKEEYR